MSVRMTHWLPLNLPSPLHDLSFGAGGIEFFESDSLQAQQDGHDGPDWQEGWLVVARTTSCGDPIFIDRAQAGLPVFTAMHGTGSWEPTPVAGSLEQFVAAIEFARPYAAGREHPVGLEEHPMSESERIALFEGLRNILGPELPYFWEILLAPD